VILELFTIRTKESNMPQKFPKAISAAALFDNGYLQ
jgi:hypothetical protein